MNKFRTLEFNQYLLYNLFQIQEDLITRSYAPGDFERFIVYEPKERNIEAPAFKDKIVLHVITDNGLYDAITHSFIRNNCANQLGKGISDAIIRMKRCFMKYYSTYNTSEGWILKCDIRHFFASINHDVIKEKLKKVCIRSHIDKEIYDLLCVYIDKTDGLPLGYQTSQLLALLMLDDLDHFITERRHFPLYVRGMDDFVIIGPDKRNLQILLAEIRKELDKIHLELNDKTAIFPIRNGVDFLGYHHYLTESGAVIQKLRKSAVKREKRKIKQWKYLYENHEITAEQIMASFQAWDAYASFGDTYQLRRSLADKVEEITGVPVIIHRKKNSTVIQRAIRRDKMSNAIAEKNRLAFEQNANYSDLNTPPWEERN